MNKDIDERRVKERNGKDIDREGDFVLYWMQKAQRTEYNHALEYSISKANELGQPLIVFFGLTEDFPDANWRHYLFMLEGLEEVERSFEEREIRFLLRRGPPEEEVLDLEKEASMLITEKAYLKNLRRWRDSVEQNMSELMVEVESESVVPVETTSQKEEYAARTIRPKIHEHLDDFLKPLQQRELVNTSLDLDFKGWKVKELMDADLDIDKSVEPVDWIKGGTSSAKNRLERFIQNDLEVYAQKSNDPAVDALSDMSPYLHFGQISPVYIALQVKKSGKEGIEDYLEELIIRRELALNFVYYDEQYDSIGCIPDWAKETLREHEKDEREYLYNEKEFEEAETHDEYWNAAQNEMVKRGKMHGYMRMYWGKKILEWSETPKEAYKTALYLNNKYELDGRDPNGYAGVAWCFGKHDQGWKERPIYGKVRYMNANGLERKFDMGSYVEKVEELD